MYIRLQAIRHRCELNPAFLDVAIALEAEFGRDVSRLFELGA